MGASDPVADYLSARKQSEHDPVSDYLSAKGVHDYHAEYASGALQKRMQGANARDAANAADPDATSVGGPAAFGHSLAATGANVAQGIPGMEAVQAGARSLVRRQPYREALGDIRGQTEKIPGALRVGERIAGSLPLLGVLPGSAAASGALIGGAEQALSADPDRGLVNRAVTGTLGAAGGAALGKGAEMAMTAGRAALPSLNPATRLLQMQADRAGSAQKLYAAAMSEGQGHTATPAIKQFLAEPDIAEIVGELQQTRPFQSVAHDSPEMLDAVYKTLSDRAQVVKKGLSSVNPSRPNIGRFTGKDIAMAKSDALDAMSGGASMPGPMPSYRAAVSDYAQRTGDMEALRRGYDAQRLVQSGNLPTGRNLTRNTPEALGEWAQNAPLSQRQAASDGTLGAARSALASKPLTLGRHALSSAPTTLRQEMSPQQRMFDLLINGGLLGVNGKFSK